MLKTEVANLRLQSLSCKRYRDFSLKTILGIGESIIGKELQAFCLWGDLTGQRLKRYSKDRSSEMHLENQILSGFHSGSVETTNNPY